MPRDTRALAALPTATVETPTSTVELAASLAVPPPLRPPIPAPHLAPTVVAASLNSTRRPVTPMVNSEAVALRMATVARLTVTVVQVV